MEASDLVFCVLLPDAHHLLSHLPWSMWCDLDLIQIPSHSVRMLNKTVYEMVKPLWR